MRLDMRKPLSTIREDVTTERIESTDERSIGMDRAAILAEKDAGACFGLLKHCARAFTGPRRTKFRGGLAALARKPGYFVRINLNVFVVTAARTASANIAKSLKAGR